MLFAEVGRADAWLNNDVNAIWRGFGMSQLFLNVCEAGFFAES
jgi:hypothetical protein